MVRDWGEPDPFADTLGIIGGTKDYSPLLRFPNLRRLWVGDATPPRLEAVGQLSRLQCLSASLRSIKDLSPLANLTNLAELSLYGNIPGVSLEPLAKLKNLRKLRIWALVSNTSAILRCFGTARRSCFGTNCPSKHPLDLRDEQKQPNCRCFGRLFGPKHSATTDYRGGSSMRSGPVPLAYQLALENSQALAKKMH